MKLTPQAGSYLVRRKLRTRVGRILTTTESDETKRKFHMIEAEILEVGEGNLVEEMFLSEGRPPKMHRIEPRYKPGQTVLIPFNPGWKFEDSPLRDELTTALLEQYGEEDPERPKEKTLKNLVIIKEFEIVAAVG